MSLAQVKTTVRVSPITPASVSLLTVPSLSLSSLTCSFHKPSRFSNCGHPDLGRTSCRHCLVGFSCSPIRALGHSMYEMCLQLVLPVEHEWTSSLGCTTSGKHQIDTNILEACVADCGQNPCPPPWSEWSFCVLICVMWPRFVCGPVPTTG